MVKFIKNNSKNKKIVEHYKKYSNGYMNSLLKKINFLDQHSLDLASSYAKKNLQNNLVLSLDILDQIIKKESLLQKSISNKPVILQQASVNTTSIFYNTPLNTPLDTPFNTPLNTPLNTPTSLRKESPKIDQSMIPMLQAIASSSLDLTSSTPLLLDAILLDKKYNNPSSTQYIGTNSPILQTPSNSLIKDLLTSKSKDNAADVLQQITTVLNTSPPYISTNTPTNTPTNTSTNTPTYTSTNTPTYTLTNTPTYTPTSSLPPVSYSDSSKVLNILPLLTIDQQFSVSIAVPKSLKSYFTSNTLYPVLKDTELPIYIITTSPNTAGVESIDITQVSTNTHAVVPSLEPGTIVEIDGIMMSRGVGRNKNKISIDNGITWNQIGSSILINNKRFKLAGIGSPAVFTVTTYNPESLLDYLFRYSFFFAFIGSILYSVNSVISIDVPSVIINKNLSLIFNMYMLICAILSIFYWYDIDISPLIPKKLFNQSVIVTRI
jgi:hypothetical protein